MPGIPTKIFLSSLTILGIVVIDRLTKAFFSTILSVGESLPVVRNVVHFTLVHNTGIAFGLFKGFGIVFVIVSAIAIIFFSLHLFRHRAEEFSDLGDVLALCLIIAGAVGNLIDRVSLGYVIDFIDFRIWPVFNVADSAITIGTIWILIKCIPSFSE